MYGLSSLAIKAIVDQSRSKIAGHTFKCLGYIKIKIKYILRLDIQPRLMLAS